MIALRDARPEDKFEQLLCTSLAELLAGDAPSLGTIPETQQNTVPEVVQGYSLLRAAVAFAAGEPREGYKAVLEAIRKQARETATIVNIGRFLPSLCAYSTQGGAVPPDLVEAVRKMASVAEDAAQAAKAARCAAAIGEIEVACKMWEQTVAKDQKS